MRLVELSVRRMPGIDEPFRLGQSELGEGLHVVHGPNGVGKTTLCRAVHALLWPGTLDHRAVSVEARFEDGGHVWHARRDGGDVQWQRDGAPSTPPEVPDEHLARCFLVTVDDLYDRDRDGGWFAERVLHEMAGGFDVRAVRRELFEPGARHGHGELRELEEARSLVRQRELEQERILGEERELDGLEAERARARTAAAEIPVLEAAVERVEVRSRLAAAQEAVDRLPCATARMAGDEHRRLEELEGRLEELRGRLRDLDGDERDARAVLDEAALESPPSPERINEQRERLDELRERERELSIAGQQREQALRRLEGVRARLGEGADLARLAAGDEVDLDVVELLVRDAQVLARDRDALEGQLRALASTEGELPDGDALVVALRALGGWLRTPEASAALALFWGWLAVGLGAVLAVVIGALLHPAGYALLAVVAGLSWMLLRQAPRSDPRAAFRETYSRTRLDPPAAWEPAAVEARLEELERARARLRGIEQARERRRELELALSRLAEREGELEQRRAALRSDLGLELPGSDLALADLAVALAELRAAVAARLAAEGSQAEIEDQSAGLRAALAGFVRAHGEEGGGDAMALARALASIERRSQAVREARTKLEGFARAREFLSHDLDGLEAARRDLFEGLDLELGDRPELTRLLELRADRLTAVQELTSVQGELRRLDARLEDRPELEGLSEAELSEFLARAGEEAARLEELSARIADIRRGVRDARGRSDLEEARVAKELAQARLEEALESALLAEGGQLLLEEVEREHERLSRPAVLARAGELFAAFTSHRYELGVVEVADGPALRAVETTRPGVGLGPEELSSGTRAQLLLAVRLAFAGQAERDLRLPVFVDDALATSDPDRLRAIAHSLAAIARDEGRQVIVLTKDEGDVALIREAAGDAQPRVVDLAALRRTQGAETRRERLELPAARRVPAPGSRAGVEYALLLEVPALDPWDDLDRAHLFHLVPDDPQLLYRVLELGVEAVGPLSALLGSGASLDLDDGTRAQLSGWIQLARRVHASWREGRGTPITRESLRECPAISATFQERVEQLAEELGWDADALVRGLLARRVERFHESKALEAREWFEERGHISPDEPLTADAAWARLLVDRDGLPPVQRPPVEVLRRRFDYLWRRLAEGAA